MGLDASIDAAAAQLKALEEQAEGGSEALRRRLEPALEALRGTLSKLRSAADEVRRERHARSSEVEAELRDSRRFLAGVLGALTTRLAVLDARGTVIAVNTAWERFKSSDRLVSSTTGLGTDYLARCDAAAAEGSEDAHAIGDGIRRVLAREQKLFRWEYRSRDRDRERWFTVRVTRFPVGGSPRAVLSIQDISELKNAEQALRRSMFRHRAVLDAAVDGIILIDQEGAIIEPLNPAAQRIFGYGADDLTGKNVSLLMPAPYHRQHDGYIRSYLATGRKKVIGSGREVVGRRKDGTDFPMELALSEIADGERRCFMGVARDITERRAMEEAVRRERDFAETLVETAQAIVLVLDREGHILRFNRCFKEISGYRPDEVRGRDWFEIFVPEGERERRRSRFEQALAGVPNRGSVHPIVTRDGTERQIEWYDTTLHETGGQVTGLLATGQDITERLELEEQFRQAQKMEAIGRLAGGVAHDFNTLLGSITGYSELLLDRLPENGGLRRPVEQIHRGAQRGASLTRQLLAFSRRQVLQPEVLDLNTVLAGMGDMLQRLVGEDVEVIERLEPALWPVKVDAGQIEQVIMNLLVNAADAMPQGGRILVATKNAALDESHPDRGAVLVAGEYVLLSVSDTGSGMDETTRKRAFEPFFTTKEPGKGTGLGLSTVYGIVRQSGGGLVLESQPERGTTARIYLLRSREEVARSAPAVDLQPTDGSETVLLVEDDAMFLELLREVLEGSGYTVLTAGEPARALELCDRHRGPLDLLVSDMVMPGMTGADLAGRLVHRRPELKVLLMSGYTDEALEVRGAVDADRAFISKPFSTKDFVGTVRRLLDKGA